MNFHLIPEPKQITVIQRAAGKSTIGDFIRVLKPGSVFLGVPYEVWKDCGAGEYKMTKKGPRKIA